MAKLLEMKNITKKFGDVVALNNISISLEMGEVLFPLWRKWFWQIDLNESAMWDLSIW